MRCSLALIRFCSAFRSITPRRDRTLRRERTLRKGRDLHKARGAGFLFFMALVAFLAGVFLLASLENEARQRTALRLEQSGVLLRIWLERAHGLAQGEQQEIMADWAKTENPGVTALSGTALKAAGYAPSWLAENTAEGSYLLGLVPDVEGIPMAFALYRNNHFGLNNTPPGFFERMAYRAAGQNSEAALIVGLTDPPATEKILIERALGSPLKQGDILVLADRHLDYNRDLLYRLPQPGHPELNRMETGLDLAGNTLKARSLSGWKGTLGEVRARSLATERDLSLQGDLLGQSATLGEARGTSLAVTGSLSAAELNVGTLRSGSLSTENLRARSLNLRERLTAATLNALQAEAQTTEADQLLSFEIGRQGAGLPITTQSLSADGLYGSDARLSGQLKVTGRCSGC